MLTDTPADLPAHGRVLALDLGAARVGVAISDESRIALTELEAVPRASWKKLLTRIKQLCVRFDVTAIVVGLPLNMDGTRGAAADEACRIARNLRLSTNLAVFMQDERLTSRAAEQDLHREGLSLPEIKNRVDSRAAQIILRDFLAIYDFAVRPDSDFYQNSEQDT